MRICTVIVKHKLVMEASLRVICPQKKFTSCRGRHYVAASADLDLSFSIDLYKVLVFDFNTFYGLSVCSMTTLNH